FPEVSRPAVSKHLSVLRQATLVASRKRGRERIYSLNAAPLQEVDTWIGGYEEHWEEQLESLKAYLEGRTSEGGEEG
ncbi:MAG: ArsR/SmtB family transcription factor, partial [Anaerolineae bacterium]